jgi:hypothetical protein
MFGLFCLFSKYKKWGKKMKHIICIFTLFLFAILLSSSTSNSAYYTINQHTNNPYVNYSNQLNANGQLEWHGWGGSDYVIFLYTSEPLIPTADIKANGSDGPITVSFGNPFTLTVQLNSGSMSGQNADWWGGVNIASTPPDDWYHYDLISGWMSGKTTTYQGPLFDLNPYDVLGMSGLPVGTYTFYFAIDMVMNSLLDMGQIYYDSVKVNIVPQTEPACSSDADCNDNNSSTLDTCYNPGTVQAECTYLAAVSDLPNRSCVSYSPSQLWVIFGQDFTDSIRDDLKKLREYNFDCIFGYSSHPDFGLDTIYRMAWEEGFSLIACGIWSPTDLNETQVAEENKPFCSAYVVGSEGLVRGDYLKSELKSAIESIRQSTGREVSTGEGRDYYNSYSLYDIVDFVSVHLHPWHGGFRDPSDGCQNMVDEYI